MRRWTIIPLVILSGCGPWDREVYTLYRNSVANPLLRIHVATFNANEEATYNQENCQVAAGLFQAQPSVKTRFWCEQGRFKK